jgi:hypothetical protein
VLLVDDDEVTIPDLLVDHRVPANPEDVVIASTADEVFRYADRLGHLNGFDRQSSRDSAEQRERHRAGSLG